MAGGSGTRLWPLSREKYPKQFLKVFGQKSLLRLTFERLLKLLEPKDIMVATSEEYEYHVRNDLYPYDGYSVILEPERKNTGPTVALGMLYALERLSSKEDEIFFVIPSDHYIEPVDKYVNYLRFGGDISREGYVVAFGIKPWEPNTNFGYIKIGEGLMEDGGFRAYRMAEFVEKPDISLAELFFKDGGYFWNSGNFVFTIETGLRELVEHSPEIGSFAQKGFNYTLKNYRELPEIAFDYVEMEKTKKGAVIPMDILWSDVGSFDGLYRILPNKDDKSSNAHIGDVLCIDSENTLAYSTGRLIGLIGVKDIAVVEERDAILVIKKDMSSKVRDLVNMLKGMGREEAKHHVEIHERWGKRLLLDKGPSYKIYRITIYPNKDIGPQMHMHSTRTWMVLGGTLLLKSNGKEGFISVGDSGYVHKATPYYIQNRGFIPAEVIEVRVGEYLEDDDLIPL